jgi:hypothetical protein
LDTTWLASGPESVSGLADAGLESELWVKDVRYGQNAFSSGYEFARTGRRTLLSFDLRTAYGSRAVDDLSLQVGTETVAPVSSGYVARRRYPAGEGARTLDFILPPGTGAEIPFTLNQRRPDGTTVPLHQGGYRQRGAPARPLRIGLKLMTITGKEGEPLRYLIPASGADLGFSMPMLPMMFDGLSLDSRTGVVAGTPSYAHAEAVMLTVTNSAGRAQAVLRIAILANAAPPEITSATEALGGAGLGFSHQIQAVNSPQSYLASNLPPDLVLNELTGVISGTPLNAGVYQVVLGASNSFGVGRQTLTLTVASSSQPPSFARMLDTSAELGKPFVYDLARFCANNPVQWGIQDLPPGLALAPATGQTTGTPLAAGFYSPTVTVRNVVGPTSVQFVFVVSTPHGLPVLVNPGILSGTVGREFQYRIQASGAPTGYGATGLPDNLAVDPRSGQISGKPGVPGRFRTLLTASNPIGNGGAEVIVDILANPGGSPGRRRRLRCGRPRGDLRLSTDRPERRRRLHGGPSAGRAVCRPHDRAHHRPLREGGALRGGSRRDECLWPRRGPSASAGGSEPQRVARSRGIDG